MSNSTNSSVDRESIGSPCAAIPAGTRRGREVGGRGAAGWALLGSR